MSLSHRRFITLILFITTLVVNGLGGSGQINNMSQADISALYPTLITPAPFAFSIWGLIYSLVAISVLLLIIKKNDSYMEESLKKISPYFWLSSVLNMAWIVAFSYDLIGLSTVFILALLLSLTRLLQVLPKKPIKEAWLLPVTFGLYSGWLLIASVVNIAAFLVKLDWTGLGLSPEIWSILILIVAVGIAFYMASKLTNAFIFLPLAWAYIGIYVRHTSVLEGYQVLPIVALLAAGVYLALFARSLRQ